MARRRYRVGLAGFRPTRLASPPGSGSAVRIEDGRATGVELFRRPMVRCSQA